MTSERIVDMGKVVQVNQYERDDAGAMLRTAHELAQSITEEGAVGKSGQSVVIGKVMEPLFLLDVLESERDVARQLVEQIDLFVIKKPVPSAYKTMAPTAASSNNSGSEITDWQPRSN